MFLDILCQVDFILISWCEKYLTLWCGHSLLIQIPDQVAWTWAINAKCNCTGANQGTIGSDSIPLLNHWFSTRLHMHITCGLSGTMMCQFRLINDVTNVPLWRGWACVWTGATWKLSVFPVQLCFETKTGLKNKVY